MIIKQIVNEDFYNYKFPSMLIAFPKCSMKCGIGVCHNNTLLSDPDIHIDINALVDLYILNPITSAIVFGGLEPFDSFDDMVLLINAFREKTNDTIIIYTGYEELELSNRICTLIQYDNIIVKYGRYIPNQLSYYNELLGVKLYSYNQYAVKIS